MSDVDWDTVGTVIASQYRREVLEALDDQPATPKRLATDLGHDIARVSRGLQELREDGLVELLVPEEKQKGRIYGSTEKGSEVLATVQEVV